MRHTLSALCLLLCLASPAVSQEKPAGDTGPTGPLTEEAFKALHELRQDDAPPPQGKMVELSKGKAYLSLPQGDPPRPAVLLIHEWWGLNPHIKHWADRLAADGYATLAVDLYGGVVATTRDEAMAAMNAVDDAAAHAVIAEGLRFLAEDPRIRATRRATVGWCFGGAWSLKAALAHPDLSGAVIYYGRLNTDPTALKSIKAPVLGVFGNEDRSIPPDVVNQFEEGLKQAGVKHQILRYDANHAFANPSSNRYDQKAAADAWNKVRAFLKQNLRPGEKADPPETGRVAPTFRLTDHEGRPVEGGPDRKTWTVLAFFPKAATPG